MTFVLRELQPIGRHGRKSVITVILSAITWECFPRGAAARRTNRKGLKSGRVFQAERIASGIKYDAQGKHANSLFV